jgi:hypothetical protein
MGAFGLFYAIAGGLDSALIRHPILRHSHSLLQLGLFGVYGWGVRVGGGGGFFFLSFE